MLLRAVSKNLRFPKLVAGIQESRAGQAQSPVGVTCPDRIMRPFYLRRQQIQIYVGQGCCITEGDESPGLSTAGRRLLSSFLEFEARAVLVTRSIHHQIWQP